MQHLGLCCPIFAGESEHSYALRRICNPGTLISESSILHPPFRHSVGEKAAPAAQRLLETAIPSAVPRVKTLGKQLNPWMVTHRLCHGFSQTTPPQGNVSIKAPCQPEKWQRQGWKGWKGWRGWRMILGN